MRVFDQTFSVFLALTLVIGCSESPIDPEVGRSTATPEADVGGAEGLPPSDAEGERLSETESVNVSDPVGADATPACAALNWATTPSRSSRSTVDSEDVVGPAPCVPTGTEIGRAHV